MKERAADIIKALKDHYGTVEAELDYTSVYQLTIAVVLSAQTTDKQVNRVTPTLFSRYPDFLALSCATQNDVESIIKSTGFYRAKAKNIIALAKGVVDNFKGKLPDTIEELVTLSGIGRKSANVIISQGFGKPGLAVDTHVGRISRRLDFTKDKNPDKIETTLKALIAPSDWLQAHLLFITHGRRFCTARSPQCASCPISSYCTSPDRTA